MVKVIYAPPPKGPMTHLGMPGYGPRLGQESKFTLWMAKQRQGPLITGAVLLACAICAIPQVLFPNKLPHTMTPEYQAATRAYMRYHNMNPIFGISSKKDH